jgi:hypothetical protein
MDLIEFHFEFNPANDDPTAKIQLPKFLGVLLGHSKVSSLVHVLGKDGLHLGEDVRIGERVLDQSLTLCRVLLVHAFARLFEQIHELLEFVQTIFDEYTKVLQIVEQVEFLLVDKVDGVEGLANVGQYVDDVGRRVDQVHAVGLTVFEEFFG